MTSTTKNINKHDQAFLTNLLDTIKNLLLSILDFVKIFIPKSISKKIKRLGDNIFLIFITVLTGLLSYVMYYFFQNKILTMFRLFITIIAVYITFIIVKFNQKKLSGKYKNNLEKLCKKPGNKNLPECKILKSTVTTKNM